MGSFLTVLPDKKMAFFGKKYKKKPDFNILWLTCQNDLGGLSRAPISLNSAGADKTF